jgi:YegS/Rv2252/BmrU family lipid kinase
MKKRILFIYNPYAGRGKIKSLLSDIIELFNKNSYEVVIYSTKCKKDAKKIVVNCLKNQKFEYIVCSGGDGTLNEVINGVMNSNNKPKIGYIPSGTTNDFAYSLKVPKNMIKAAQIILDDTLFPCDIGTFNEKYFVYSAAFGLFTDTAYQTPQTAKNILGRLAYVFEGIKRLPSWKSYHMDILYEDKLISDNFIYGMVANSNSVGGFKGITGKDVLLNDGQFEGLFIKTPHNVMDVQNIINDLRRGNLNSGRMISFPVKNISLMSNEAVPWTIDGEFGGEVQTVNINNCKQAITIATKLGTILS